MENKKEIERLQHLMVVMENLGDPKEKIQKVRDRIEFLQKQEISNKINIKIEDNIILPEINFEKVKEDIANKDVLLIAPDVASLLEVKDAMEKAKKAFLVKVEEQFETFDKNYKELTNYIDETLKPKLIDYVDKTGTYDTTTKTKLDKDGKAYDEFKETFNYNLPKGFEYKEGTIQYEYHESLIPEEYKTVTIKKAEVKKAFNEGILSKDVVTLTKGKPSITLKLSNIKKGIE